MFAQLANTILHGVRIFDEAAKNTTPTEMNRPDDCNEARSGHHRGENSHKETTMTFDDEPGKTACGLYIGSAGNGNTICETATQLFRKN